MAKSMDPTLEELRREQARLREAQAQKEQKPLTAVEQQRQEQARMRTAQAQQKPLTAITVALAGKETKAPTMAGLRQAEQQMTPNMTMAGLKLAEKNETGVQAARQALARMQKSGTKQTLGGLSTIAAPYSKDLLVPFKRSIGAFPEKNSSITMLNAAQRLSSAGDNENAKLQNSGTFDTSHLSLNKAITNYEQEIANENLTPDLEAELKRSLTMARNITESNPELAYAILEYVASKGLPIEYNLDILREKQSTLQAWLTSLREQFLRVASKNTENSQKAIKTIIEQQAAVGSELQKVEAQIQYMKKREMKDSERKYPFYSTLTKEEKDNILNNLAENVADYYQEIWYNVDENKAKQLWLDLYPALSTISTINQADKSFPINLSNTAGKEAFSDLKKDRDVFSEDGYIIDQRKLTEVGYSTLGNSPGNGCGWISAYNALKVLGEAPEPYNIMREVESGALLAGLSGTDPLYLVRFFRSKGYNAEIYVTKEDVERETLRADASILVYGYAYDGGIGAHFITGYPEQSGSGKMRFFNDGYKKEDYIGSIDAHYRNYDIFRFAICINKS